MRNRSRSSAVLSDAWLTDSQIAMLTHGCVRASSIRIDASGHRHPTRCRLPSAAATSSNTDLVTICTFFHSVCTSPPQQLQMQAATTSLFSTTLRPLISASTGMISTPISSNLCTPNQKNSSQLGTWPLATKKEVHRFWVLLSC